MTTVAAAYLSPTAIIDSDEAGVLAYAHRLTADATDNDPVAKAVRLYYGVRDDIRYDPYCPFYRPEHYQASRVLKMGRGYCVCKAALLCALGRACRIPSRVGFANVRNHLASSELIRHIGTDLFVYHGYTEFWLNGRWVKATPAFNRELCRRHNVDPLPFDGRNDSIFQPYNKAQQQYMEYTQDLGVYADIPVDTIVAAWKKAYGPKRVQEWIDALERSGGSSQRDFYNETVLKS